MRFAVDDVGAGYSGLSQLATLRPTYVKLDRALVRGLDRDPARVALVRALADYARGTGGLLVAEGVETVGGAGPRARRGRPAGAGLPARPARPALAGGGRRRAAPSAGRNGGLSALRPKLHPR